MTFVHEPVSVVLFLSSNFKFVFQWLSFSAFLILFKKTTFEQIIV